MIHQWLALRVFKWLLHRISGQYTDLQYQHERSLTACAKNISKTLRGKNLSGCQQVQILRDQNQISKSNNQHWQHQDVSSQSWCNQAVDTPIWVRKIRLFVRFCNFYREFIRGFSKIAKPLNTLIKKDMPFAWTEKCNLTFKGLKQRICKAPILIYFVASKLHHLEIDSSDYVSTKILSQKSDNRNLHSVAYFLKKMVPAECNYKIYNKKLLAII